MLQPRESVLEGLSTAARLQHSSRKLPRPNQVASSYFCAFSTFVLLFLCAFFLRTLASITQLYWLCLKIKRAVPRYAKFPCLVGSLQLFHSFPFPTKLDRCKHLNYLCWIWIRVQTNQSFDQIKVVKPTICICAVVVATKMKRF